MSKQDFVTRFNDTSMSFMKDLIASFPDIKEFVQFKSALSVMCNMCPRKPCKMFKVNIRVPFGEMIQAKDEAFFINNRLVEEDDNPWLDFIQRLQRLWQTLGEEDKAIVWKYMTVLCLLNQKVDDAY
jgi:hypothetical protein